jgi:hypothetical protein
MAKDREAGRIGADQRDDCARLRRCPEIGLPVVGVPASAGRARRSPRRVPRAACRPVRSLWAGAAFESGNWRSSSRAASCPWHPTLSEKRGRSSFSEIWAGLELWAVFPSARSASRNAVDPVSHRQNEEYAPRVLLAPCPCSYPTKTPQVSYPNPQKKAASPFLFLFFSGFRPRFPSVSSGVGPRKVSAGGSHGSPLGQQGASAPAPPTGDSITAIINSPKRRRAFFWHKLILRLPSRRKTRDGRASPLFFVQHTTATPLPANICARPVLLTAEVSGRASQRSSPGATNRARVPPHTTLSFNK